MFIIILRIDNNYLKCLPGDFYLPTFTFTIQLLISCGYFTLVTINIENNLERNIIMDDK